MITYLPSQNRSDLQAILDLQQLNISNTLSTQEIKEQGFVTVVHTLDILEKMQQEQPHILAKEDEKLCGYVISMTEKFKQDIPILVPFFQLFEALMYQGKPISAYPYIVVGQVCVAKEYRGKGVFGQMYESFRKAHRPHFRFTITEIALHNTRSIAAHTRLGFKEIYRYTGEDGLTWLVVLWDFEEGLSDSK